MTADGAYGLFCGFAGLIGALFGSFMNVCVARMPADRSVVYPGSACPHCGHAIRPWDNVPVLAWLALRGRCRDCKAPISPLYPVVEAFFAVLTVLLFRRVVPDLSDLDARHFVAFAWYFFLLFALCALTFIDLRHSIIPDEFSVYAVPFGVGGAVLLERLGYRGSPSWQQSVFGAAAGAGLLLAIVGLYWLWRRQEGMGMGDVKLLALLGSYFGAIPALPVILGMAATVGSVVGVGVAVVNGRAMLEEGGLRLAAIGAAVGLALQLAAWTVLYAAMDRLGFDAVRWPEGADLAVRLAAAAGFGAVVAVILGLLRGGGLRVAIPFGPFLAFAGIAWLFFGEALDPRVSLGWTFG